MGRRRRTATVGDTAQDTDSGNHFWLVLSAPSPTGTIAIASFMTHRPRINTRTQCQSWEEGRGMSAPMAWIWSAVMLVVPSQRSIRPLMMINGLESVRR